MYGSPGYHFFHGINHPFAINYEFDLHLLQTFKEYSNQDNKIDGIESQVSIPHRSQDIATAWTSRA